MPESVIQSLWIGPRLSAMGRLAVQSFLAHGATYHLYCYDDIADVPAGAVIRDAAEILPRESVFAYREGFGAGSYSGGSNFFRYKLLLERGGWWTDTDVVCLQPFDFVADSILASELRDPGEPGPPVGAASSVIRQPAGSALMRWTWRACRERNPDQVRWGEVGPRLLGDTKPNSPTATTTRRPSIAPACAGSSSVSSHGEGREARRGRLG
jgi:hypothetical protein